MQLNIKEVDDGVHIIPTESCTVTLNGYTCNLVKGDTFKLMYSKNVYSGISKVPYNPTISTGSNIDITGLHDTTIQWYDPINTPKQPEKEEDMISVEKFTVVLLDKDDNSVDMMDDLDTYKEAQQYGDMLLRKNPEAAYFKIKKVHERVVED